MTTGRLIRLILVVCFWGLIAYLYIEWRIRERRNARQGAIERQATIERLLNPDWEFYERHLQRSAPAALRKLFANRHLVVACGLDYNKDGGISTFNPLDKDSLVDANTTVWIGHDIVPFAFSDCGDPVYLRPGATEPDTVYIAYHDDPGNIKILAESIAAMVEKLKRANQAT